MTNYKDFLNEQMKDAEFKKEYDALDAEFSIIQAMLDARKEAGLTQKDLAARTGIAQADISKLENGNANPSLRTLQRLADGMGMKLKVEFVPANR
ncbi:MAG: helix-turn-helix transcriptional regulator [Clostridia bacterium]|nr:helix-turn-helix transcriptional regulator [Clostridia bacterium]